MPRQLQRYPKGSTCMATAVLPLTTRCINSATNIESCPLLLYIIIIYGGPSTTKGPVQCFNHGGLENPSLIMSNAKVAINAFGCMQFRISTRLHAMLCEPTVKMVTSSCTRVMVIFYTNWIMFMINVEPCGSQ